MSKPLQDGKKYLQLTSNILLEYTYVKDRYGISINDIDDDILGTGAESTQELIEYGSYGKESVFNYMIARNDYTNEWYFGNNTANHDYTHNSFTNTVLPIRSDATEWVQTKIVNNHYYSDFDPKWCSNISSLRHQPARPETGYVTEYVTYDIIRIYFQSGYHPEYDGWIFNFYTKDYKNRYVNLLCALHENTDDVKLCSSPMWFADKIYTSYIEYRIPSTAYLTTSCILGDSMSKDLDKWTSDDNKYDSAHPLANTLPYFLTDGYGFYNSPSIGVDVHGIIGYSYKYDFKTFKTRSLVSTLFPNTDTYDKLIASVRNSTSGDYYEIYGYYENDPSNPIYDFNSMYEYFKRFGSTFSFVHIIDVTENFTNDDNLPQSVIQPSVTYVQTWDNIEEMYENGISPVIKFRPVLEHTSRMIGSNDGATIRYTLRAICNRDNVSIIKTSSCTIIKPRRFGLNSCSMTFSTNSDIHIYNRIENSPSLNINEVVTPVSVGNNSNNTIQINRYVTSSFIDRRNIRVSVSPVKIENIED